MSVSDAVNLISAAVQGAGSGAVFLLALFLGSCIGLGYAKLRPSGPRSRTVRSLDEALGQPVQYLPPAAPRGTTDQLAGSRPRA